MDTSDSNISFDENGLCEYCYNFKKNILPTWNYGINNLKEIDSISKKIQYEGRNKDYDCIIGVSGGLDSSYAAYVAKHVMGLRPLLFHVDAGWNTEQAVNNIEKLVDGLGLDLYTEVINWDEIKDLQIAFLKSQIADQDSPQDIAFFSSLYKFARKNNFKYVITGANYSTECCREPEEWGAYPGIDKRLIMDIYKKYGKNKLKTFPIVDILVYKILYQQVYGMKIVKPLNLIPYNKLKAESELELKFGWRKFKHKHHESRFTLFYEDYWLPNKFNYSKRRAHFSSLIMTNQMNRIEALERISTPEMDADFLRNEFDYVASKLGITSIELKEIFNGQNKTYNNYKNKKLFIKFGAILLTLFGLERRLFK
jgi:N-acetyl sugar amidotransferase